MAEILDRFRLRGKVAVVTGGAGWLGSVATRTLAEAGAHVVVAGRDAAKGTGLADGLREMGYLVDFHQYDQTDHDSITSLVARQFESHGHIDILVNNAAAWPMSTRSAPVDDFRSSMEVNAVGLFDLTRSVAESMGDANGGSIITVGSIFGVVGPDRSTWTDGDVSVGLPDYFFHKGGSLQLTRWVAAVYGTRGVRANYIALGPIDKPRRNVVSLSRMVERIPSGRIGDREDLAGPILFLASDASAYVNGAQIAVDGGYTAI